MPDRTIFLDFDGVLNSHRTARAYGRFPMKLPEDLRIFDDVAISLIRSACKELNATIIVSSTWRRHRPWRDLAKHLDLPIVGLTPFLDHRGKEIQTSINARGITEFCIVDDDSFDVLPEHRPFFVHVDGQNGLSYDNYLAILSVLSVL